MSNSIYNKKSSQKFHYVYQITEISTNKKYIGSRTSKIDPILDLGLKYFSSSSNKNFIKSQKENPTNFKYKILSAHNTREEAIDEEIRLHNLYDVGRNLEFYNESKQSSSKFDTTGKVSVKDKNNNSFLVNCDDDRFTSGELEHVSKNLVVVKDKNNNIFTVHKNDQRYISGELVSNMKGLFHAKDINGKIYTISKDDQRFKSGELVGLSKGKKMSNEAKIKISQNSSKPMLGKKHTLKSIKSMKDKKVGDKNPRARSISINGKIFTTIKSAAEYYNTYPVTVRRRLNSDKFKDWYYL